MQGRLLSYSSFIGSVVSPPAGGLFRRTPIALRKPGTMTHDMIRNTHKGNNVSAKHKNGWRGGLRPWTRRHGRRDGAPNPGTNRAPDGVRLGGGGFFGARKQISGYIDPYGKHSPLSEEEQVANFSRLAGRSGGPLTNQPNHNYQGPIATHPHLDRVTKQHQYALEYVFFVSNNSSSSSSSHQNRTSTSGGGYRQINDDDNNNNNSSFSSSPSPSPSSSLSDFAETYAVEQATSVVLALLDLHHVNRRRRRRYDIDNNNNKLPVAISIYFTGLRRSSSVTIDVAELCERVSSSSNALWGVDKQQTTDDNCGNKEEQPVQKQQQHSELLRVLRQHLHQLFKSVYASAATLSSASATKAVGNNKKAKTARASAKALISPNANNNGSSQSGKKDDDLSKILTNLLHDDKGDDKCFQIVEGTEPPMDALLQRFRRPSTMGWRLQMDPPPAPSSSSVLSSSSSSSPKHGGELMSSPDDADADYAVSPQSSQQTTSRDPTTTPRSTSTSTTVAPIDIDGVSYTIKGQEDDEADSGRLLRGEDAEGDEGTDHHNKQWWYHYHVYDRSASLSVKQALRRAMRSGDARSHFSDLVGHSHRVVPVTVLCPFFPPSKAALSVRHRSGYFPVTWDSSSPLSSSSATAVSSSSGDSDVSSSSSISSSSSATVRVLHELSELLQDVGPAWEPYTAAEDEKNIDVLVVDAGEANGAADVGGGTVDTYIQAEDDEDLVVTAGGTDVISVMQEKARRSEELERQENAALATYYDVFMKHHHETQIIAADTNTNTTKTKTTSPTSSGGEGEHQQHQHQQRQSMRMRKKRYTSSSSGSSDHHLHLTPTNNTSTQRMPPPREADPLPWADRDPEWKDTKSLGPKRHVYNAAPAPRPPNVARAL